MCACKNLITVKLHGHITHDHSHLMSTQSADDKLVMQSQSRAIPLRSCSLTCQVCKAAEDRLAAMSADMHSQPSRHSGPGHVAGGPSNLKPQVAASGSLSQPVTINRLGSIPEASASKGSGTTTGQNSSMQARSFSGVSCLCTSFMPVVRNIISILFQYIVIVHNK